jgi:hypothetical protein
LVSRCRDRGRENGEVKEIGEGITGRSGRSRKDNREVREIGEGITRRSGRSGRG